MADGEMHNMLDPNFRDEARGSSQSLSRASQITARRTFGSTQHQEQEAEPEVPDWLVKEIQDVFNLFDTDGCGAIDPKEIRTQMMNLGFQADNTTIYQLISDLDSDGSQRLEYEELEWMMKSQLCMHTPSYNTRRNA